MGNKRVPLFHLCLAAMSINHDLVTIFALSYKKARNRSRCRPKADIQEDLGWPDFASAALCILFHKAAETLVNKMSIHF